MLFNSLPFIFIFLPIVVLGYYLLGFQKKLFYTKLWLVGASLFFYGYWTPRNIPVFLLSVGINFLLAKFISQTSNESSKQRWLSIGLIFNISFLGVFKYTDFIITNFNTLTHLELQLLHLALPLGISFFTLNQIAFLIDLKDGLIKKVALIDYALFVSFFPYLVAGPLVSFEDLSEQQNNNDNKKFNPDLFSKGLFLFSLGLFKKAIISDTFSDWVAFGFDEATEVAFLKAWQSSLCYSFQLYFDFSGYSDMAMGVGYLFNLKLPQNFNSPFKSTSIIEFWNRWHISLSQFINTYIFTPLLRIMPKVNFRYSMLSVFLAFTIAGIWHGAAWTFVIYGVMHGLGLIVNHNWKKKKIKLPKAFAWFLTFNFVNLSFVMFRAKTVSDALKIYKGMFGLSGIELPKLGMKWLYTLSEQIGIKTSSYMTNEDNLALVMIIGSFILIRQTQNSNEQTQSLTLTSRRGIMAGILFVISLFGLNRVSDFIYFNF